MHQVSDDIASTASNPPGAIRMAIIAFVVFNLSLGCMFGPFGVLIEPIEQRLNVTREISTLAVPIVTLMMAALAPVVGGLVNKVSLRLLMMAGSAMMAIGFGLLAVTTSVPVFLGAYALLIGPGLSICGIVGPSTLVTRWFKSNRGKALGIAATPALMAVLPLLTAWVLGLSGVVGVFWMFAGIMAICLGAAALAIDWPKGTVVEAEEAEATTVVSVEEAEMPLGALLSSSRYWRLALAAGSYNGLIVMFATTLVPFAMQVGIAPTTSALLLTGYLVGTLVGTPLIGWGADKLGGIAMIVLTCLTIAIWFACLLVHPGFVALMVIAFLIGLQGSAMPPSLGMAFAQEFGQANFAKAWGFSSVIGLPFSIALVPISSMLFVRTGSYDAAFILSIALVLTGMLLPLTMMRRRQAAPAFAG